MNLLISGGILFLFGFLYRIKPFRTWDRRAFKSLHTLLQTFPGQTFFRELWFLGKTPFSLILLLFLVFTQAGKGLIACAVFLLTVTLERLLKLWFHRPRPFQELPYAMMTQPSRPTDPSFPSGDCMRAWFLATLLLPIIPGLWVAQALLILLALLIALGRIAMGVHYPSDVISGVGLGILAGQLSVLLWYQLPLLLNVIF